MNILVVVVGVCGLWLASCGSADCKTDCAFKCANSPTHDCAEQCEKDDCGIDATGEGGGQ